MNNQSISKGNRIKVVRDDGKHGKSRGYGTVGYVSVNRVWYFDDAGHYRVALHDECERVHGLKGKPVTA